MAVFFESFESMGEEVSFNHLNLYLIFWIFVVSGELEEDSAGWITFR